MMFRKFIRTAWDYRTQFVSMILMIAIGVGAFLGFNISWYSLDKNVKKYIEETDYANYRLYSEELFSKEDVEAIRNIKGVRFASRVLCKKLNIEDSVNVLSVFCLEDYEVSKMQVSYGAEYDENLKGMWLSDEFAKANGVIVGDTIEVSYLGYDIDCEVVGLAKSMEYLVCIPDENQIMPDYGKYGFAYISPAKLYEELEQEYYPQINIVADISKEELKDEIIDTLDKKIYVSGMEEHIAYRGANNEINDGKVLGVVLPVVFLVIALLTMMTTMHRITGNERSQIGTLKSMGFTDGEVARHYILYGLFTGIIGSVFGVVFGLFLVRLLMSSNGMLSKYLDLPYWQIYVPSGCYVAVAITIFLQIVVCYYSVKRIVRGSVAGIFRHTEMKLPKGIAIERNGLLQHFGFTTRWNIRDIKRHKLRSIMSLTGVTSCITMLIVAFGLKSSTKELISFIDNEVYNYETKIDISDMVNNQRICEFAKKYEGDWVAGTFVEINNKSVKANVYDINNDSVRFVLEDGNCTELEDEGIYISTKLADGVKVGDYINIYHYASDKQYNVKVLGIIRSVIGENISMSRGFADSIEFEYQISSVYTNVSKNNIEDNRIVLDVLEKDTIIASYGDFMNILNVMISILIACSIVLGSVVLYNLGMMAYAERVRELATLKVLGYRDKEITGILITQNLWMTISGIIIGLPLGNWLLKILVKLLATEFEMKAVASMETYVISIIITVLVSIFIALFVADKNKHIDMVQALKENE